MSDLDSQYNFETNTITIHIQLLPKTELNQPRVALIGVGISNSPPILSKTTLEELRFPDLINSMLVQLENELPQRKAIALELLEKQKLEESQHNYQKRSVDSPPPLSSSVSSQSSSPKHQLTLF